MARRVYSFDPPDRFVPGAVGAPGQRTFYLQARDGETLVSVVCEKVQVAALTDRLGALLEELRGRGIVVPSDPSGRDGAGLEEPVEDAFRAITMTIAWDTRTEEVILEARAATDDDEEEDDEDEDDEAAFEAGDDDPDGPDLLRVRLTPSAVVDFIATARDLLAAGRPPCPWCGQPLEATGHFCARKNGNRAN